MKKNSEPQQQTAWNDAESEMDSQNSFDSQMIMVLFGKSSLEFNYQDLEFAIRV